MVRFLTFRGLGRPAEFVSITVVLPVLFPVIYVVVWFMSVDQNPQAVRVLANVSGTAALIGCPWVWLAALVRHIRWLRSSPGAGGRTTMVQLLAFRGVGHPAEFVTITVVLAVLLPAVIVTASYLGGGEQHPLGVRIFGSGVGWVAFLGYPWIWVATVCRHLRWLKSLKA